MARPVAHGEPPPRAIPPDPGARRVVCNRQVLGSIIGGAIGAARGTSYVVTPLEIVRSEKGAECRKYVLRTVSGARQQEQSGTACRRNNGAWEPRV